MDKYYVGAVVFDRDYMESMIIAKLGSDCFILAGKGDQTFSKEELDENFTLVDRDEE